MILPWNRDHAKPFFDPSGTERSKFCGEEGVVGICSHVPCSCRRAIKADLRRDVSYYTPQRGPQQTNAKNVSNSERGLQNVRNDACIGEGNKKETTVSESEIKVFVMIFACLSSTFERVCPGRGEKDDAGGRQAWFLIMENRCGTSNRVGQGIFSRVGDTFWVR